MSSDATRPQGQPEAPAQPPVPETPSLEQTPSPSPSDDGMDSLHAGSWRRLAPAAFDPDRLPAGPCRLSPQTEAGLGLCGRAASGSRQPDRGPDASKRRAGCTATCRARCAGHVASCYPGGRLSRPFGRYSPSESRGGSSGSSGFSTEYSVRSTEYRAKRRARYAGHVAARFLRGRPSRPYGYCGRLSRPYACREAQPGRSVPGPPSWRADR